MVLYKQNRSGEHFSRICADEFQETLDRLQPLDIRLYINFRIDRFFVPSIYQFHI